MFLLVTKEGNLFSFLATNKKNRNGKKKLLAIYLPNNNQ